MPFEPVQPARLAAPRDRRALATVAGSKRAARFNRLASTAHA
ncbi:conserved hypothetical protein [Burkholderia mallei PRL-20]|uniref:Uncharacterized protein n=3 Tax=pseudomallei group TaxID=111527 RepID=A2RXB1_BURM9|nr:hypothetical protein [Burkholderia mallei]ABM48743.1 conserved hypothetical protein [Burkholderia mallei SAVP1]ABM98940.1 hypothetical protein BMA10229_0515 [Burkholderia mallei NCTC 10229]ABN86761.1 conserved hypothetical protein [Burkholderia pseudomallei 668]ABN95161.1 conserved hypothetical protein [Burkholderia pseudomallei 1106a]AFR19259.1 hypothetical protein BPC006_II1331 [Burkholderia pseudomallei BPC006]EDK55412.1 hypothetical protein BMAFMH_E0469 [Burkholderia mallei FMH]EDK613